MKIEVAIPAKRSFDELSYNNAHSAPVPDSTPVPQPPPTTTVQPPAPMTAVQAPAPMVGVETPVPIPAHLAQHIPKSVKPQFRVELPSSNINRGEYMEVAEKLELPEHLSQRKKARLDDETSGAMRESLDQRQRSDAALMELSRRTQAIDRAVRAAYDAEPGFDQMVWLTSEQEPALTAEEQKKMHTVIQKIISLNSLARVPVEYLTQTLRLSEASLKDASLLELHVDKDWDEAAVEAWILQLPRLDTALKAARTSARILSGGREDKQLYSESLIENIIQTFKKTIEDIVIPLVEFRSSGNTSSIFRLLLRHRKELSVVFISCQKLLSLLAELVSKVQLADLGLNTLEFIASNLIFVDNAFTDKDSVVGTQKFDGIRSAAMDMLCQIFMIKPAQRHGILNEILTSLSKLPGSKQSSKQFKLADGGSVQPVSALIMRLVQASSSNPDPVSDIGYDDGSDDDEEHSVSKKKKTPVVTIHSESQGADQHDQAVEELCAVAQPLSDEAQRNASMVINFLVQRAIGSSKSGETPFRNLLDLCVDDFTTCLELVDWPAAEVLLRCLMSSMVHLFEAEKSAAPTKNMALEILGNMSAAISRLRSQVKKLANATEGSDADDLLRFLSDLANHMLDREGRFDSIVAWSGPYRIVLESLTARSNDTQLVGATSFLIATWADRLQAGYHRAPPDDDERDRELGRIAYRLRMMVEDRTWLANQYEFRAAPGEQTRRLSYLLVLLGSPLCENFDRMLSILLHSMSSDQASVRSKSLKSVNHVLETDPSILDGNSGVIDRILESVTDNSPQVRESALSLLGNCFNMRRGLELSLASHVLSRLSDSGVAVRRRAMKLVRDIYLRNYDSKIRSEIAGGLLRRTVNDLDDGIKETGRQMIEEIWFEPFYKMEDNAVYQTALAEHSSLIIRTVKMVVGLTELLDKVFQSVLKGEKKGPVGPSDICARLISNMFHLLSNADQDTPDSPSSLDILQVLTIFARADPALFNFEQIRHLKPHLTTTEKKQDEDQAEYEKRRAEEVQTFRAVANIFRLVLPQLSTVHSEFITEIRAQLVRMIAKVGMGTGLSELAACLRVICDILNDVTPIKMVTKSALLQTAKLAAAPKLSDPAMARARMQLGGYFSILGAVLSNFDLDSELGFFQQLHKDFKGDSVTRLVVDKLLPFASPNQHPMLRRESIDSIATICQAWPRMYTLPKVGLVFEQAFKEQARPLENIILRSFKEFLFREEKRSEASTAAAGAEKEKDVGKEKKSLKVMGGTSYDDVASATTQQFLSDITRISLASQDVHALQALQVLGSINRQGLTHPKETVITLVTLETSSYTPIAELAFREHKTLHEKHESTLETQYTKAVQSAYEYQRDIVGDTHGATFDPPQAKLYNLMHVFKVSKLKKRQRFLEKIVDMMDFDLSKLQSHQEIPPHVSFVRFILENLAAFEYHAVGELQNMVHRMEKLVNGTGTTIAQAIDSELFHMGIDALADIPPPAQPEQVTTDANPDVMINGDAPASGLAPAPAPPPPAPGPIYNKSIEPARLRKLATAATILSSLWEVRSYLRRLYGMGANRHDSKAKALAKDLNRTPTKTQGVHWDKFWEEFTPHFNGLTTEEAMVHRCKVFVEVMNVDKEFKFVEEDDEDMDLDDPATPSGDEGERGVDSGGRKRKGAGTPGGRKKRPRPDSQPRKRGRPRKNPVQETQDDVEEELDWF